MKNPPLPKPIKTLFSHYWPGAIATPLPSSDQHISNIARFAQPSFLAHSPYLFFFPLMIYIKQKKAPIYLFIKEKYTIWLIMESCILLD